MPLLRFVCLLVACQAAVGAIDEPPKNGVEDCFGIDVEAPSKDDDSKKVSVRLKGNPGNNLTALAQQFFDEHRGAYTKADFEFVVNHLEEAAGGKCDACKTLVEVMTETFKMMGTKFAKVVGRDQFGKEQKAMHVDEEMESYIASMCRSDEYNGYAPHIRKGCNDILGQVGSRGIFSIFNNGTLGPETVVTRKVQVCGELLQLCNVKPTVTRESLSKCQACGEVMEDLHFALRRANRHLVFGGDKLRNKMKKSTNEFLSRRHIVKELEDLCEDLELRHSPAIKDELQPVCETLVADYEDDIADSFMAMQPGGHQKPMPGREVCVGAAEMCSQEEYINLWPRFENYAYNFSYFRKLPAAQVAPDGSRSPEATKESSAEDLPSPAASDESAPGDDSNVKLEL